jgi:hypothetical protein
MGREWLHHRRLQSQPSRLQSQLSFFLLFVPFMKVFHKYALFGLNSENGPLPWRYHHWRQG